MGNRLYFRTDRFDSCGGKYEHLHIQIFEDKSSLSNNNVSFTWQANFGEGHWYGGKVDFEANGFKDMQRRYKLASRVIRGLEGYELSIQEVQEKLRRLKAVEVVYDGRVGEYLELDKVAPPEFKRYMDHPESLGTQYIKYAVLAHNEDEAKTLILSEAAQAGDLEFVTKFVEAGYPVWVSHSFGRELDIRPLAEKIKIGDVSKSD